MTAANDCTALKIAAPRLCNAGPATDAMGSSANGHEAHEAVRCSPGSDPGAAQHEYAVDAVPAHAASEPVGPKATAATRVSNAHAPAVPPVATGLSSGSSACVNKGEQSLTLAQRIQQARALQPPAAADSCGRRQEHAASTVNKLATPAGDAGNKRTPTAVSAPETAPASTSSASKGKARAVSKQPGQAASLAAKPQEDAKLAIVQPARAKTGKSLDDGASSTAAQATSPQATAKSLTAKQDCMVSGPATAGSGAANRKRQSKGKAAARQPKLRECTLCRVEQPVSEFEGGSDLCCMCAEAAALDGATGVHAASANGPGMSYGVMAAAKAAAAAAAALPAQALSSCRTQHVKAARAADGAGKHVQASGADPGKPAGSSNVASDPSVADVKQLKPKQATASPARAAPQSTRLQTGCSLSSEAQSGGHGATQESLKQRARPSTATVLRQSAPGQRQQQQAAQQQSKQTRYNDTGSTHVQGSAAGLAGQQSSQRSCSNHTTGTHATAPPGKAFADGPAVRAAEEPDMTLQQAPDVIILPAPAPLSQSAQPAKDAGFPQAAKVPASATPSTQAEGTGKASALFADAAAKPKKRRRRAEGAGDLLGSWAEAAGSDDEDNANLLTAWLGNPAPASQGTSIAAQQGAGAKAAPSDAAAPATASECARCGSALPTAAVPAFARDQYSKGVLCASCSLAGATQSHKRQRRAAVSINLGSTDAPAQPAAPEAAPEAAAAAPAPDATHADAVTDAACTEARPCMQSGDRCAGRDLELPAQVRKDAAVSYVPPAACKATDGASCRASEHAAHPTAAVHHVDTLATPCKAAQCPAEPQQNARLEKVDAQAPLTAAGVGAEDVQLATQRAGNKQTCQPMAERHSELHDDSLASGNSSADDSGAVRPAQQFSASFSVAHAASAEHEHQQPARDARTEASGAGLLHAQAATKAPDDSQQEQYPDVARAGSDASGISAHAAEAMQRYVPNSGADVGTDTDARVQPSAMHPASASDATQGDQPISNRKAPQPSLGDVAQTAADAAHTMTDVGAAAAAQSAEQKATAAPNVAHPRQSFMEGCATPQNMARRGPQAEHACAQGQDVADAEQWRMEREAQEWAARREVIRRQAAQVCMLVFICSPHIKQTMMRCVA